MIKEKTEQEKMLANKLYLVIGEELAAMYLRASQLLNTINLSPPDDTQQRQEMIQNCGQICI